MVDIDQEGLFAKRLESAAIGGILTTPTVIGVAIVILWQWATAFNFPKSPLLWYISGEAWCLLMAPASFCICTYLIAMIRLKRKSTLQLWFLLWVAQTACTPILFSLINEISPPFGPIDQPSALSVVAVFLIQSGCILLPSTILASTAIGKFRLWQHGGRCSE